jgi:hypothetical protein
MLNIGNSKQAIKWRGPVVGRMNLSRLEKIATRFFAATPFFHVLEMSLKLFQIISCNRHYKLFAKKFDLLIIPYSGQIAPDFDFHIWNARRCGLKSLAIQENWDHLSTKSFFRSEPDYFGLWGAQSAGHLRTIQKKEKCEGVILGSPRFNTYNEQADTSSIYVYTDGVPIKVQSKEYILIGGTGDGFDDLEIISTVMKVLGSRVTTHNERLMVVYRPHPFTRTTIDYGSLVATYPQIAIDYGAGRRDTKHLSTLVRNAILNVNLLSTLTLESSISGVPCIVPAYIGEGMNLYGYKEALDEWHHLMGIQLISTVSISHSVEEFTEKLEEKVNSESEEVSVNLDWIVKKQDYISHLCKLVEKLVKD